MQRNQVMQCTRVIEQAIAERVAERVSIHPNVYAIHGAFTAAPEQFDTAVKIAQSADRIIAFRTFLPLVHK